VSATPASPLPARPSLWPRIAAVAALLAPVATAVIAAIALAGDVPVALLTVGLVVLCCAAIWLALTGRGARRAASAALASLSGIGLLVVLVTNWQGVVVLVALLLLLAVFGAAARYALGRTGETAVSRAAVALVPVGAAGSAVLIINLKSGGGKAERFNLAAQAQQRGIEPVVLQPGDDLLELAEGAIAGGAQVIGMAGGDGSQALVVQSDAYRDAKLETWTDMLPDLLGPDAPPIDLEFTASDGSRRSDAPLVLVSNNPHQVTSLAGAGTRERIDTGELGVVAAPVRSAADVSQLVLDPPLRFASLPGALRVRLPRGVGLAPAARAAPLTTDNLRALLRVAAGK
jgi:hypothetical protein